VIAPPINDHDCLGPTTDQIIAELEAKNPAMVDLATQFENTDDLAAWFRTLPQRDDHGVPCDGPKVEACNPPQRLQLDNPSPNCFERSARFIGAAELIEPDRVYRLATTTTPQGLHTFPTRDGEPVILDPDNARNAQTDDATRRLRLQRLIGLDETKGVRGDLARAQRAKELGHTTWVDGRAIDDAIASLEKALVHFRSELAAITPRGTRRARNHAGPIMLTPQQAIDWITDLAMIRVDRVEGGARRIENGHRAMCGVLVLRPICIADVRDVALVLALAEREARAHGVGALKVVHSTARAIDKVDQIAAERASAPRNSQRISFAFKSLEPLLGALARVGGRVAGGVGLEALKLKLASVGVSPPVLSAFEKELNREGLSLGPLAKPSPMIGSLDAMTPQALAGRWLAQKI
jgi:hypothetical protein